MDAGLTRASQAFPLGAEPEPEPEPEPESDADDAAVHEPPLRLAQIWRTRLELPLAAALTLEAAAQINALTYLETIRFPLVALLIVAVLLASSGLQAADMKFVKTKDIGCAGIVEVSAWVCQLRPVYLILSPEHRRRRAERPDFRVEIQEEPEEPLYEDDPEEPEPEAPAADEPVPVAREVAAGSDADTVR